MCEGNHVCGMTCGGERGQAMLSFGDQLNFGLMFTRELKCGFAKQFHSSTPENYWNLKHFL